MNKKVLRWNFVFQYGWVITNIINSLLLLPLYVKFIDANTLGVWLATTGVLYWMTMVDPGIGEVLQQKIAELRGKNEKTEIGNSIGSGLIASAFILLISIGVGIVCYYSISFIIDKDVSQYRDLSKALFITIIATGMSLVSFTLTGINQGLHNSAQVAISSLTANLMFLLTNLLFLYLGFGIMSIAIANLIRALYINIYNFIALKWVLNKSSIKIGFNLSHFRRFIKIFSFTSLSKIISGLSNSIDMIVLARYISPAMITTYEINKRPLNLTGSLIGRHSVALMPVISHAKGEGDKAQIINLINKQFRIYMYAALLAVFMFAINYDALITLWVGEGMFIGNNLLVLLLLYNFISLISYFMSNVSYALGDIKNNSMFLIIRNILFGFLVFLGAKYYGMTGTIVVSLSMTFLADFFFFSYRVYRLGYLQPTFIRSVMNMWMILIPLYILTTWFIHSFIGKLFSEQMLLGKMLTSSTIFVIVYLVITLLVDSTLRSGALQLKRKLVSFA